MPQAVSRKQYRMMQAILHGKGEGGGSRGRPPKSVAAKYSDPGKDAPDTSGEDRGGTWGEAHHSKDKEKVKEARRDRKKGKLKKALTEFCKSQGVGLVVINSKGRILLGTHDTGTIGCPGGHVEPGETFEEAAYRELKEETGLEAQSLVKILRGTENGNDSQTFLVQSVRGKLVGSDELKDCKWVEPQDIDWSRIRDCSVNGLKAAIATHLGKSLKGMMAMENLEKNIIRSRGTAVFEMTHGDSLRLVGNGLFRRIKEEVGEMGDESFKDIHLDTHTISIRKHMNDVYSGRVSDGHKIVWQFTNKSLPELTGGLMSVFEWYLPEDEQFLEDHQIDDDAIEGGVQSLMDNYRRHNIGNIYNEMETIREQMRNGMAVDLLQIEGRIMKLFDTMEDTLHEVVGKHNDLAVAAGKEMDDLEAKLRDLQSKIEAMGNRPQTVEAYSSNPADPNRVHDDGYPYLPRPQIEISPNGKIKISFTQDWTSLEKENFLNDMRAKVINKASKTDGQ